MRRIMGMLFFVLWTMNPQSGGWRRYFALVLDSLSPAAASRLPLAANLPHTSQQHVWLI
jgi:hypothetical protein